MQGQTNARLFFYTLLLILFSPSAFSQTTYFHQDARENVLLERMEITAGTDSILNFSKLKPFSRKQYIRLIEEYAGWRNQLNLVSHKLIDSLLAPFPTHKPMSQTKGNLSGVDLYNAQIALMSNPEWTTQNFRSKKPFLKHFYKSPANFYEVNVPDFRLVVNPVFQYLVGKERNSSEHLFLNSRGVALRGLIANKIGFNAFITDNQERDPAYVRQFVAERQAVPGQGYYKEFKGSGYDYIDARGTITFNAAKYIDIAFGYDRNFIGNGYRSLFLSEFATNQLFLKLNTRIWKLNYQNLFMELVGAYPRGADQLLDKKYAAMHHLDVAVTKWLNVGLFEGVIFGRPDRFEFGYLNPVIFYRSAEQQNGSPDNAVAGLDVKANVAKRFQFYGQLLLDELKVDELKKKWWGNKFGFQLGGKYIDAFNIPNLDLQAEWNRVRPFTYSHDDSVANYTHYNQPLAHPLGANFNEFIGIVRYQPIARLSVHAKAMLWKQGKDLTAASSGSNIFLPNTFRGMDYGFSTGGPVSANTTYASLLLSYEFKPNLFVDVNAVVRNQSAYANVAAQNTSFIYAGIRWNMHRREFVF